MGHEERDARVGSTGRFAAIGLAVVVQIVAPIATLGLVLIAIGGGPGQSCEPPKTGIGRIVKDPTPRRPPNNWTSPARSSPSSGNAVCLAEQLSWPSRPASWNPNWPT